MKSLIHKNLGNVYITDHCIFLQERNPDPTSIFVEHDDEIKEVCKHLLKEKVFYFFEAQEGGMEDYEIEKEECSDFRGWMSHGCKTSDKKLLAAFDKLQVGEMHQYRLGVLVRLKDRKTIV